MSTFVDFLVENQAIIGAALTAVGVLVIAFVRWTPTKKDDEVLDEVQETVDRFKGKK